MKTRQGKVAKRGPRSGQLAEVIDLTAHRRKPAEDAIEESLTAILAHVRAGKVKGFAFAVHFQSGKHTVGGHGSYVDDTVLLRGAAAKLAEGAATLDEQES